MRGTNMTGPEHYRRAEQLVEGRDGDGRPWTDAGWYGLLGEGQRMAYREMQLREAAIHATLAQAAATALAASLHTDHNFQFLGWPGSTPDLDEWQAAVSGASNQRKASR